MDGKWKWDWQTNDQREADCGIYMETYTGLPQAICRCPRYLTKAQWQAIATHICDLHNAAIA